MAQYFSKRRQWSAAKLFQYLFAILALLIALAILLTWLFIRYQKGSDTGKKEPIESAPAEIEISTEPNRCLLIFDFENVERFVLVQADAGLNRITTVPIPSTITDEDGCTLAKALHRHGAQSVTKTVSDVLELPFQHYMAFTPDDVEQFLSTFDSGITFSVPEKVSYTENKANIQMSAGEQLLSPGQVRTLLAYNNWKKASHHTHLAADLTAAVLNQYLVAERPLEAYFFSLSNVCATKLRIDNFNSFYPTLQYLAEQNKGALCRRITLPGNKKNGLFIPNIQEFRSESDLYR